MTLVAKGIRPLTSKEHLSTIVSHQPSLEVINQCYKAGAWSFESCANTLSKSAYRGLREHMIGTGWFAEHDGILKPNADGADFLARVGELYRGINREKKGHKALIELLGSLDRGAAVDIGCGPGQSVLRLAELGYGPLHAYELSPIALQIAETLLLNTNKTANLYLGDATQLSEIKDSSLALIFSRGAFHYFNQKELAKSIGRTLRPGGYVVAEIVGLRYYLRLKHLKTLFHPRHLLRYISYWRTVTRTVVYELTTLQPRLGASASEIGFTLRSIRRLARLSGLKIMSVSTAPTMVGYLIVFRRG